jgi:proliferating cell nuclear antigen
MFRASLPKETAVLFKGIIESIKDLVQECNIDIYKNCLEIVAIDTSHVALIHMLLPKELFLEFECERDNSMGISLVTLSKVFKCMQQDDTMTLTRTNEDQLEISFKNQDRNMEFSLNLMDIDTERFEMPDCGAYDVELKMQTSMYSKIMSNFSLLGNDSCVIESKDNTLAISTNGDIGSSKITLSQNENIEIKAHSDVLSSFSMRYLLAFSKSTVSSQVSIYVSADIPLLVSYKYHTGFLNFFVAARLSDN